MTKKKTQKLLKKVQADYDQISEHFDKTRKHAWPEFKQFLPYIKDGDFVADIGCGNGRLFDYLASEKKIKYIGVDNSKGLLEKARKNYEANFIEGELQNIPIDDNAVDTVAEIASFHHLPNKELRIKALQEAHRILKNHGTLILTVWNLFQPKYKKYIWKARIKSLFTHYSPRDTFIPWAKTGIDRYYYAFTERELSTLIENNGFKINKTYTGNNLVFICQKV